jgi:hypothetical protein
MSGDTSTHKTGFRKNARSTQLGLFDGADLEASSDVTDESEAGASKAEDEEAVASSGGDK